MKIFGSTWWRASPASSAPTPSAPTVTAEGIAFQTPAPTTAQWLSNPFDYPEQADLGARLEQLRLADIGTLQDQLYQLSWNDVYTVLLSPQWEGYPQALDFPPLTRARPKITSRGGLLDKDFAILLDGWLDPQGAPLQPAPRLVGRVLQSAQRSELVPDGIHQLLSELESFHRTPSNERDQAFKERALGRIRKLATQSHCPVSDYVTKTIVLTPEKLRLHLQQRGEGDAKVLEVIPGFEDAPDRWLDMFDRLPLQDGYDIPDGAFSVRILVSPEVKSVLTEIKGMPGRRVVGPRAQAFVRNPFGALGESASQVIDVAQFEAARDSAGIQFFSFTPHVEHGDRGEVVSVVLSIHLIGEAQEVPAPIVFDHPQALDRFLGKLWRCLDDGSSFLAFSGLDLEIDGDASDHAARLQQWLREWQNPALWTSEQVLDLSNYSDRIEDIGQERPFVTPLIVKKDAGKSWFEDNASVGLSVVSPDGQDAQIVPVAFSEIPSLQEAVAASERAGLTAVALPGVTQPVPIADAKKAVRQLAQAHESLKKNEFEPPEKPGAASPKKRLIIKRNLDDIDYNEERVGLLEMPAQRRPKVPKALRPEIDLKPHQETGIAWLQHLWEASPDHCRGTILADDMGLGKTLQLLTFIAQCFEEDPTLPPALVVAPVALLNNWYNELTKFFTPGTLPTLMLYGDALRSLRASKFEIDADLKAQGVTRLLKKNWVGNHQLVLTTYETMRDLEFAMAAQPWSIMVCDEAQKIKTPSAMVTRSAKKQKVRFRVACTGTPVENTLADLWCLFDYVQPGMLGALNHFSRTYRQPIEAKTEAQVAKVEELRKLIKPQILHRKKTEVAKDLPVPVEDYTCKVLPMSAYQNVLYSGALNRLREERQTNPSAQLQALQAIRKICSDPHGFAEPDTRSISIERLLNESPKMGWMIQRLKALAADQGGDHKVIIFCEFRELQLVIQRVIAAFFGFAPSIVNGDTSADPRAADNRQQLIDAFQGADGFRAIILSPLAVGFGVNIQAANHVIHFTRTWNPAKEDQATARAYRIGQKRTVTVYYPSVVSPNFPSFDIRLDELLSRKRELASDMLNGCSDLRAADFADFG